MVNRLLEDAVEKISEMINFEFGILNDQGFILASSHKAKTGTFVDGIQQAFDTEKAILQYNGYLYKKIHAKNSAEMIVYVPEDQLNAEQLLSLLSFNFEGMKPIYDDKHEKTLFLRSILEEDTSISEIIHKAKAFHIQNQANRSLFLVYCDKIPDIRIDELFESIFPNRSKDFILCLDEHQTILIKEMKTEEYRVEIDAIGKMIYDTIGSELMVRVSVGVGSMAQTLKDLHQSFKEAQLTLKIGRIFESDKPILHYSHLGMGRLIYQMPVEACNAFLEEIFQSRVAEGFDDETLFTVQKFFDNNLNLSETARQLFIHRNTLVYRLDRIQKLTGLDLKKFDDAIIFKVALLVRRYLDKESKIV